ncbi:beta-glucosidase 17-like [Humulus lupulus]|uniref:beta-glucosidase 17-like n=1 Tax=Humulus lupulus TaxID=3486 RepID=UPI002B402CA1|nr:beta-glucosidase 17-like [Humulus lupulus]
MKKIGLDSFRFSISWPRILPKGKLSGGVNQLGVEFYNNVINELLANGITPFVTLFHWDTPQALEEEYGSWLSTMIVDDFVDYVDFCFKSFGDRVKIWVTINEPNIFSINAYNLGSLAPGRCSSFAGNCTGGDSATEPYIVGYHLLLAHAAAVNLYREKYQPHHRGKIGITIAAHWFKPKFNTAADRRATTRAIDFLFGWFIHPVIYGDYPESMSTVGNRLPKFSGSQSKLLKGSIDFLGLNYYTTKYAQHVPLSKNKLTSYDTDRQATLSAHKKGIPIGTPTAMSWLFIYPKGLEELLLYIKEKYNDPVVYINENGMADATNDSLPIKEALKDSLRIRYHHSHLSYLLKAFKHGANVKGYYVWCFWDDFEWGTGYTVRFGLTYIDFKNNLKRHLKYSAYWFKMFLLKY